MPEFNGYDFDDLGTRKRIKFIAIRNGELDLNNAYGFKSERSLKEYLKEEHIRKDQLAVFKVTDVSQKYL